MGRFARMAAVGLLCAGTALPAAAADLVQTARQSGVLDTLLAALDAGGLTQRLRGSGPFTLFAPSDAAFDRLPEGTLEVLLQEESADRLIAILTYHVVAEDLPAAEFDGRRITLTTLNGKSILVSGTSEMRVNDAEVVATDLIAENGVIHVLDSVLVPDAR